MSQKLRNTDIKDFKFTRRAKKHISDTQDLTS